MTRREKKNIIALSKPFDLVPFPFKAVAERLDTTQEAVLTLMRRYKQSGLIRRVGIVLGHRQAGLKSNALVVWRVEPSRIEAVGKRFADVRQVSHCYARRPYPGWPYTLYTMVHEKNRKAALVVIGRMARKAAVREYKILFTVREFKKTKADLEGILS